MTNIFTRLSAPTAFLFLFVIVSQTDHGLHLSNGTEPPFAFTALGPFIYVWIIGWWMQTDCRKRGVTWLLDMGFFLSIAWPFIVPYHLFKTRGIRGFIPILVFVGIFLGATLMGVILGVLMI
jgi:hypothetical protein